MREAEFVLSLTLTLTGATFVLAVVDVAASTFDPAARQAPAAPAAPASAPDPT